MGFEGEEAGGYCFGGAGGYDGEGVGGCRATEHGGAAVADRYGALRGEVDRDEPGAGGVTRDSARYGDVRQLGQREPAQASDSRGAEGKERDERRERITRQTEYEPTVCQLCESLRMPRPACNPVHDQFGAERGERRPQVILRTCRRRSRNQNEVAPRRTQRRDQRVP